MLRCGGTPGAAPLRRHPWGGSAAAAPLGSAEAAPPSQVCGNPVSTNSGRVLRPATDRLVLYLRDINLPKPDKYDTIQLIAFLQQLITYKCGPEHPHQQLCQRRNAFRVQGRC